MMTLEFRMRYRRRYTNLSSYYHVITDHSDEAVKERERLIDIGFEVGPIEWRVPLHGWIPMHLLEEVGETMAEFRVKWEYCYDNRVTGNPGDFYYYVESFVEAAMVLDVLTKYDNQLGFTDARGSVQFNHWTLGWVTIDDDDSDDDLEGEAYLTQSG